MKNKIFDSHNDHFKYTACLNYGLGSYPFIKGYKDAADIIICKISETNGTSIDGLVYPALYLYRHHIELFLKDLIHVCGNLYEFDDVEPFLSKRSHSISSLWSKLKEFLAASREYQESISQDLNPFDSLISEVSIFDKSGTSFRYHKDTNGKVILCNPDTNEPVKHCNLFVLYEEMQKFSEILECLDMDLKAKLDLKMEFISEMQAF